MYWNHLICSCKHARELIYFFYFTKSKGGGDALRTPSILFCTSAGRTKLYYLRLWWRSRPSASGCPECCLSVCLSVMSGRAGGFLSTSRDPWCNYWNTTAITMDIVLHHSQLESLGARQTAPLNHWWPPPSRADLNIKRNTEHFRLLLLPPYTAIVEEQSSITIGLPHTRQETIGLILLINL